MKAEKIYKVVKTRKGRETEIIGTVEEIKKYFSYTLEIGHSYEPNKVNLEPKTIKSLISNIEKALDIKEGSCFERTFIELKGEVTQETNHKTDNKMKTKNETSKTKVCSKCKQEKELTEFPKDKNRKDGHHSQCKECKKASRTKSKQPTEKLVEKKEKVNVVTDGKIDKKKIQPIIDNAHKEAKKAINSAKPKKGNKICVHCGSEKNIKDFYKDSYRKDGYSDWCKDCTNDYTKSKRKQDEIEEAELINQLKKFDKSETIASIYKKGKTTFPLTNQMSLTIGKNTDVNDNLKKGSHLLLNISTENATKELLEGQINIAKNILANWKNTIIKINGEEIDYNPRSIASRDNKKVNSISELWKFFQTELKKIK